MKKLTHTDSKGKANMVDVSGKPEQRRKAVAEGHIRLRPGTLKLIRQDQVKKGDVLTVAEIAGIQAGKRTGELIPLCHPLRMDQISVTATPDKTGVRVRADATCTGRTGVEMEALTSVSVALLTIYDMCKAVDHEMVIEDVHLLLKEKI
jgi:cyclic pyranopterin monophosphate synthase